MAQVMLPKVKAREVFELAVGTKSFGLCGLWEPSMAASVSTALLSAREVRASLRWVQNQWNSYRHGLLRETQLDLDWLYGIAYTLGRIVNTLEHVCDLLSMECMRHVPAGEPLPEEVRNVLEDTKNKLLIPVNRFLEELGRGQPTDAQLRGKQADLIARAALVFDRGGKIDGAIGRTDRVINGLVEDWETHRATIRHCRPARRRP